MDQHKKYSQIKKDILEAIENIRADIPEAAEYLEKHLIWDDVQMTCRYTGDDRIKFEY